MLQGLPDESNWKYALYPVVDGKRTRRPAVAVIDDPDEVDRFFARQGAS